MVTRTKTEETDKETGIGTTTETGIRTTTETIGTTTETIGTIEIAHKKVVKARTSDRIIRTNVRLAQLNETTHKMTLLKRVRLKTNRETNADEE